MLLIAELLQSDLPDPHYNPIMS